jgi:hypothetical protein
VVLQLTSPVAVDKPRKRTPGLEDLSHPLLGDQPTLRLLPDPSKVCCGFEVFDIRVVFCFAYALSAGCLVV